MLVLASADATFPQARAAARGLEGFVRSLAKELGRKGSTANCIYVSGGALSGLGAALDFFATDRSAYVSGQAPCTSATSAAAIEPPARSRVALVTGAAAGIGAATSRRLAAEGMQVVCVDIPRSKDALAAIAQEVRGVALPIDITAGDAASAIVEVSRGLGGIDVLVHNAGITRDRTFVRMTAAEWDSVLAVNLDAVVAIDGAMDQAGTLREGAREICLASISGIAGNAGQANYSTSKAALIGYVQARSALLRARAITVNAVAPGFIETSMTARIPFMIREAGRRLNSLWQGGLPQDVAEAIAFLARPEAHAFSGQTLRVCGQSFLGA